MYEYKHISDQIAAQFEFLLNAFHLFSFFNKLKQWRQNKTAYGGDNEIKNIVVSSGIEINHSASRTRMRM